MSLQDNQGPYTWRDTWASSEEIAEWLDNLHDYLGSKGMLNSATGLLDAAACIRDLEEEIEALKGGK